MYRIVSPHLTPSPIHQRNSFSSTFDSCQHRFKSVEDLGPPEQAAARILDQYLNKEFMSTRLGIRREGEVLSASSRTGPDGRIYYDIDVSGCHGSDLVQTACLTVPH